MRSKEYKMLSTFLATRGKQNRTIVLFISKHFNDCKMVHKNNLVVLNFDCV